MYCKVGRLEKLGKTANRINPDKWQLSFAREFNHLLIPEFFLRTRLEGGNVKNLTRKRLVKVGRRQFNPPCREIRESLTRVDPTCKGYPVKKATSPVPHNVHVCPSLLWETHRKSTGHPLFLVPSEREKGKESTSNLSCRVENKEKRFASEGNIYYKESTTSNLS